MKRSKSASNSDKQIIRALGLATFSSTAYFVLNKTLSQTFGPEAAVFLTNLIDKYKYFEKHDKLKGDGWFFQTHEHQMKQTGIKNEFALRRCKKIFKENGTLKTKFIGQPAKEHYQINMEKLISTLGLGLEKTKGLGLEKTKGLYIDKELKDKENKDRNKAALWEWKDLLSKNWLSNESFQEVLNSFTAHRKEIKKPLGEQAATRIANKLQKYPIEVAIEALDQSIQSNWTGVFPESIKPPKSTPPNKSPEEILTDCEAFGHFRRKSGKYSPALFNGVWKDVYLPALEMMSDQKCEQELAQALASFANQLNQESQKPNVKELAKMRESDSVRDQHNAARWARVPGTIVLLGKYVDWLGYGEQDWIKDRSLNLFKFDNAVFRKWRSWYEEDIGVDIITGKAV